MNWPLLLGISKASSVSSTMVVSTDGDLSTRRADGGGSSQLSARSRSRILRSSVPCSVVVPSKIRYVVICRWNHRHDEGSRWRFPRGRELDPHRMSLSPRPVSLHRVDRAKARQLLRCEPKVSAEGKVIILSQSDPVTRSPFLASRI